MNVEFLVHGTLTGGFACWPGIDRNYCSKYYRSYCKGVFLKVEILKNGDGKLCTYYNYLCYNNVSSKIRPGSYFGMTVRIDGVACCDLVRMFYLLDDIFSKKIVGAILKANKEGYIYTCDSFEEKEDGLNEIKGIFARMMEATFVGADDFCKLPLSLESSGQEYRCNPQDLTRSQAKQHLFDGHIISISPEQPAKVYLKRENELKAERDRISQKAKSDSLRMEQEIKAKESHYQSRYDQLEAEKESLEKQLKEMTANYQKKVQELKNHQLNANIQRTAQELKEPLIKLAGLMAERFPENDCAPHRVADKKREKCDKADHSLIWKRLTLAISAFAVVLIVILAYLAFVPSSRFKPVDEKTENVENMETVQKNTNSELNVSNSANTDSNKESRQEHLDVQPDKPSQPVKYIIDINPSVKNGMKKGTTYSFKLKNSAGSVPDGSWWISGGTNPKEVQNGSYKVVDKPGTQLSIEYKDKNNQTLASQKISVVK